MARPPACDGDTDRALVEALQAGRTEALDELMRRNERWLRGVVYAVLGRLDEVDDVTQHIWMLAWRKAGSLSDPDKWRPWLCQLARNAAIDATRSAGRRRRLSEELTQWASPGHDEQDQPDRAAAISEEHDQALRAVRGLPRIYREPFVLRHLEDWTYEQTGEALGITVEAVASRLVRARRMLCEQLRPRGKR